MGGRVAFCVEEAASRSPEIIGLEGESLDSQDWLAVFTDGGEARRDIAAGGGFSEFWVVSCDDVEPINLAASIKSDAPQLPVRLVTSDACGSLFSRAHTAQIDEVIEHRSFPRRYAELKRRMGAAASAEAGNAPAPSESEAALAGAGDGGAPAALVPAGSVEVLEPPALREEVAAPRPETRILQVNPRPRPVSAPSEGRAFVLTVVSGSGGAGKSATSAIAAIASRNMGNRTLLLDCDLQFGDVAGMVGVENPIFLDEALAHPDRLEAEIARSGELTAIAAPARLEASETVVHSLPGFLGDMMARFDVIVMNTGASWAEQHAALLERSSVALFLIDQRASSVRACRHALELCARCGIATGPFQFALNRCAKGAPLTSIDVSYALQGAPVFELKDGGRDVEDYLSGGEAVELVEMKNEFAKSVEQVMAKLLPGGGTAPAARADASDDRRAKHRRRQTRKRGRKS